MFNYDTFDTSTYMQHIPRYLVSQLYVIFTLYQTSHLDYSSCLCAASVHLTSESGCVM